MEIIHKGFRIATNGFEPAPVAGSVARIVVSHDDRSSVLTFTAGIVAINARKTEEGKSDTEMPQILLDLAIETVKRQLDAGQLEIGGNYAYTLQGRQFVSA